jgi:hypothetical protein
MAQPAESPGAERRGSVRRSAEYAGSIQRPRNHQLLCVIWDISDTGARLVAPSAKDVPEKFILTVARNGQERYYCRVIWRSECQIGVAFLE